MLQDRKEIDAYKKETEQYQRKIKDLEEQIIYYRKENEKLASQNEMLHETAWKLIWELRELRAEEADEKKEEKE